MDQRWMKILLTLVFHLRKPDQTFLFGYLYGHIYLPVFETWTNVCSFHHAEVTTGADRTIQEGFPVDFKCQISEGTMVFWFRMLDGSNMEFIASFSNTGIEKKFEQQYKNLFSHAKKDTYSILTLKSFSAPRDSGAYVCAALVKGNMLNFGEVERVHGEKKRETTKAPLMIFTHPPTTVSTRASTRSCACSHMPAAEKTKPLLPCDPLILGSLAGGCGLLLLLLIIITLYCNRLRTRRCPHHYKRKPRVLAPEKQMTNARI
uniref:Ig-like domain-containing protein n=1 Tax=Oryzias latipes TaxID=8090 RepID=A0A3P9H8E7_ORYLA